MYIRYKVRASLGNRARHRLLVRPTKILRTEREIREKQENGPRRPAVVNNNVIRDPNAKTIFLRKKRRRVSIFSRLHRVLLRLCCLPGDTANRLNQLLVS